jgi:outer membrane protein assembly factor BamB
MAYASSWTDIRKNPRHSGGSIDTLGSNKLVEKWSLQVPAATAVGKDNAPLIYKDTVFYTSGNTLFALDANGDTHGGMWPANPDGSVVIWSWSAPSGGTLSAPTIATVQNPAPNTDCSPIEAVMVQNSQGTVFVLNAFPINPDYTIQTPIMPLYSTDTASGSGGTTTKWPSPPIYVNGWIYALGGDGRLYAANPCWQKWGSSGSGRDLGGRSPVWEQPSLIASPGEPFADPECGPSFGSIKTEGGTLVGMVYWFIGPQKSPPITDDINDHIWGVPVSVSMDKVRLQNIDSTRTHAEAVASYPGWLTAPDPCNPKSAIRIMRSNGVDAITLSDVTLNMNSAGASVPGYMKISTAESIPTSPIAYASYWVSYGSTVSTNALNRAIEPIGPPSGSGYELNATTIPGIPAMGPDNMLYICGHREPKGSEPAGGSILAYRTDGVSTNCRLKWHYFLHSGVIGSSGGYTAGTGVELPGVVQGATGPMLKPEPCSSPAVAGDKVFVTVSGDPGGPRAALLCFKANPEFVIRITESGGFDQSGKPIQRPKNLWRTEGKGHYDVRLWQPNLINAATGTAPLMDARPVGAGVNVDYDNGIITFNDFSLDPKLAVRGSDAWKADTFSPSLPVWVFLDNIEVPIDWTTWGPGSINLGTTAPATSDAVDLSSWNNLLWYYIVPDSPGQPVTGAHSPPVVIGDTVYFITDDGMLYAFTTETGESNGRQTSAKPIWSRQVGTGTIAPGLSQSVAGSNGVLLVPAGDGLHAFSNTTTLVADNNRVVELDGDGEVVWCVDSITWPATTPGSMGAGMAIKQGPVNKPSCARYVSTGEILFANSGANQVCKIDKGGMVGFEGTGGKYVRWIYDKFVDPKHLLRSGQPTSLRAPTDAIMWQEMEPPPTTSNIGVITNPGTSVVHCVIADSGNSRILDLVYRVKAGQFVGFDGNPVDNSYIDADSGFVMPELNWASKTDQINQRYVFNCLQLVPVPNSNPFREDIWAASSNYAAGGTDLNTGPKGSPGLGGAILAISYRYQTPGTSATTPGLWMYDDPDPAHPSSGRITARCDHVSLDGRIVPVANPRFFDVINGDNGIAGLLICDDYGVYQVSLYDGTNVRPVPLVTASLLDIDYRHAARGLEHDPTAPDLQPPTIDLEVPLNATGVQRLPNGHWLIANNYSGANITGTMTFGGEVFEFDPTQGGSGSALPPSGIPWCSPRLQWIKPAGPGLPDSWKQVTTNTYNLKQPRTAFRQF